MGDLVALMCTKYNERPQIGKIIKISKDATIKWFDGTWNSKWRVYTYKVGKKTMVWEEEVKVKDILTNEVFFTPAMRLPVTIKQKLQNLYDHS